jgi:hypothetical protein
MLENKMAVQTESWKKIISQKVRDMTAVAS